MKRELKAAVGATALLAGAATVVVVGGATSGTAAGTPSSAYGITASLAGNELLAPTPYVVSTTGAPESDSLATVPVPDLANVGLVEVTAENNHATSNVAGVTVEATGLAAVTDALAPVLDPLRDGCDQLAAATEVPLNQVSGAVTDLVNQLGSAIGNPVLTAPLVEQVEVLGNLNAVCDTLDDLGQLISIGAITAECTGKTGVSTVGDISLLGLPVVLPEGVNQALSDGALGALAPVLDLKLNTQTTNADGTFSVTALELDVLAAAGDPVVHLEIGHVTCGNVTNDVDPTDPAVPAAPKPTPIKTDVPVTG
ncbi:hypothetical protein [Nocardioides sp.]|uniref:hypothetical protein n=1 Tax=Nocardioides sp. TaxID=35761 RepID=UPI002D101AA4|nr:hypothetical protein [Nocardioides sp.]HSX67054.1 hypothetical protein [Nocardioides sp.]